MYIYEVNIQISKSIYKTYLQWLNSHAIDMLKNPGFNNFKIYEVDKEDTICVHYYIDGIDNLNYYLDNNSKSMRSKGKSEFKEQVTIKRRILKLKK